MAAFESKQVTLSATAVKAVDPADFDREVVLSTGGMAPFQFGFNSTEVNTGVVWNPDMSEAKSAAVLRLILPADEELWVKHPAGGTVPLQVLVTKAV